MRSPGANSDASCFFGGELCGLSAGDFDEKILPKLENPFDPPQKIL